MDQELDRNRCRDIRQILRDIERESNRLTRDKRTTGEELKKAWQELPIKERELRQAKLKDVGSNAIGLISGPAASTLSLALSNMVTVETLKLEDEITKLKGIITRSQSDLSSLQSELDRLENS